VWEEHAFDPERHDRAGFSCGVPALDDYLHRFAAQTGKAKAWANC
jgi:hypothetical protein